MSNFLPSLNDLIYSKTSSFCADLKFTKFLLGNSLRLAGKILALVEIMVLDDLCQGRPSKAKATNFGLRATAKARINITGSVKLVADG